MFDIGMPEMLVLAVVTLLVVGPKDLPRVIRSVAGGLAKMRRVVGEFRAGVDEFVREAELGELREAVEKTRAAVDVRSHIKNVVDPTGELQDLISPTGPSVSPPKGSASKGPASKGSASSEDAPGTPDKKPEN